ncbi:MAG: peptidoglycan-binding domain-containing protein, partial [Clostridia bacterium]
SPNTYLSGGETYCSVYYNNTKYNAVYSNVRGGIMTTEAVSNYITSLWNTSLTDSLKRKLGLVGDVRVYAMQLALSVTGYYTGVLDGNFGSGSESAVRNFQRKNKIKVDGACGNETWGMLCAQAKAIYNGGIPGGNPGGGTNVPVFGTITSIEKAPWKTVDGGSTSLFKKGTQAQVLDITTGKVFSIYRWSGGNHADCVPLTANDTKIMCDIVGFPYNAKHPTSAQLSQIKADTKNNSTNYVWPDFNNAWGGAKDVGSQWDRRPALVNVNGRVFCVSIYGYPHGFNGTDSFATAKFADGSYFYSRNNYYGMMCVHFVGSTTHTPGNGPDPLHQANIETAYTYAKQHWPTLVK